MVFVGRRSYLVYPQEFSIPHFKSRLPTSSAANAMDGFAVVMLDVQIVAIEARISPPARPIQVREEGGATGGVSWIRYRTPNHFAHTLKR